MLKCPTSHYKPVISFGIKKIKVNIFLCGAEYKCQISKWGQKEGDSNSCVDTGFGQREAPARDDINNM